MTSVLRIRPSGAFFQQSHIYFLAVCSVIYDLRCCFTNDAQCSLFCTLAKKFCVNSLSGIIICTALFLFDFTRYVPSSTNLCNFCTLLVHKLNSEYHYTCQLLFILPKGLFGFLRRSSFFKMCC